MFIDIHVHSEHSENAELKLTQVVQRCQEAGLDGFCLTDVHCLAGLEEAKKLAGEAGLVALVGFEAFTELGHFLVFVPKPEELPQVSDWVQVSEEGRMSFDALAKAVDDRAGVMVAAHPYAREVSGTGGDVIARLSQVAALEVLNGRYKGQADELAEEMAAGMGMAGVGGSDARHSPEEMGEVASLLGTPVKDEAELIACIRAQDIWPARLGGKAPEKRRRSPRKGRDGGGRGDRGGRRREGRDGRNARDGRGDKGRRGDKGGRGRGPRRGGRGDKKSGGQSE